MKKYDFRWKTDAPSLKKIKEYVSNVTDVNKPTFVTEKARIAVFDVDGTLISETDPHYLIALLWIHAVLEDDTWAPSAENLRLAGSFRDSITLGTPFECNDYDLLLQVEEERYQGMTTEEYSKYITNWLSTQPSRFFDPMVEIVELLKRNGFNIFLISGSDRDFMRCLTSDALGIPPHNIIGSDVEYNFDADRQCMVHGKFLWECDGLNKVKAITREIGQQPILAFGNSSGDYPMFRFTQKDNPYPSAVFCLLNDDPHKAKGDNARAQRIVRQCWQEGWETISMASEWI